MNILNSVKNVGPLAVAASAVMLGSLSAQEITEDLIFIGGDFGGGNAEIPASLSNASIHSSASAPVRKVTPTPSVNTQSSISNSRKKPAASRRVVRRSPRKKQPTSSQAKPLSKKVAKTPVNLDTGKGPLKSDSPQALKWWAEAGYQSDYVYHGLSQIKSAVVGDPGAVGMFYAGGGFTWTGFAAGVKFVQSDVSDLTPQFDPSTTTSKSYSEFVLDLNYSYALLNDGWLDATVGYQGQFFEEETFWNTDSQHKYYAKLAVNRYSYFRPSVAYYHFEQGDALTTGSNSPGQEQLTGSQWIFQIDGGVSVYSSAKAEVALGYYAQIGLDDDYNVEDGNGDWLEYGLALPVSVSENLSVIPNVHYTDSLKGSDPQTWWGMKVQYQF